MSFMPMDPDSPLYRMLNPGMPTGGAMGGLGGLLGRGPSWLPPGAAIGQQPRQGLRGLLSDPNLGLALLANSGPSAQPRSFGQILGTSALQAKQIQQDQADAEFKRKYMEAQMGAMQAKDQSPQSVKEYEYAVKNGYKGSYQDWTVAGGQTSRPSSVQEWEFYKGLGPEEQKRYLELKRNPNWKLGDINQIPTVVQGLPGGGVQTTPLSTLPQVSASAETVKQAEGRGGAVGKTQGEITGGIMTKGSNAVNVLDMTKEARNLLKDSTGSLGGTGLDKVAASLGVSTKGAQAGAQLKVLQAGLMTNMPRMEGPQSDADVKLYQQAAAQIGDTTIPVETRAAALDTIDYLQRKYQERAKGGGNGGSGGGKDDPLGIR